MSEPVAEDDDREVPLCPGCLAPVEPHDPFCAMCGQPLTSAATTLPMERIRSLGEMTRRGAERPKTIALIGIWLIFGPPCLVSLIIAVTMFIERSYDFDTDRYRLILVWDRLPYSIIPFAMTLIFGGILWRTTANYLSTPEEPPVDDVEDYEPDLPSLEEESKDVSPT